MMNASYASKICPLAGSCITQSYSYWYKRDVVNLTAHLCDKNNQPRLVPSGFHDLNGIVIPLRETWLA
jgi:hypothetical protein